MDNNENNDFDNVLKNGDIKANLDEQPSDVSRTMDKSDIAKMIARNLSANNDMDSDFDFEANAAPIHSAVKTAVPPKKARTHTQKNTYSSKKKRKKRKMSAGKKAAVISCSAAGVMVAALGVAYFIGMCSYKGKFLDNTYINTVDVSGKTKDEAVELVKKKSSIPEKVTIQKADGTSISIKLSDIGYNDNTANKVAELFEGQSHSGWFGSKFKNTEYNFENNFKYDKSKLEAELKKKIVDTSSSVKAQDAYIKKSDGNEYVIVKEKNGDKIDADKVGELYSYVESFLDERTFDVDLMGAKIYEAPKVTAASLQDTCDKLNNIYNISITFDFNYTTETITGDKIMDWIALDDDEHASGYTVDEDKAMSYVETLAEKYDTYGKDRQFKSTKRGTITVKSGEGCYGWWIDQEKTRDLLVELIEDGESANTEPIYYKSPDSSYEYTCDPDWRTKDKDWGDTYIEIDLSAQHLWYYKDGKVAMETDIVSGYPNASRNTPEGVYKLWYKETGKTLRGSADGVSYASYVDYWNNISTIGIGLHDASWQNGVFGGTKYKSSTWGSHGCINMPFDKAKYVYDNIEMGTPVFAYWS